MAGRPPRAVALLLAAVGIQAAAVLAFVVVERRRAAEQAEPWRVECLASGRPAPDLELLREDGSVVRLAGLRGRPVLLHFWATWCPPCREELPGVLALQGSSTPEGPLAVMAVALDADWGLVRGFLGPQVPPGVVRAGTDAVRLYGLGDLPDTYLVSPDGSLRGRIAGARDWRADEARAVLPRACREPTGRAAP